MNGMQRSERLRLLANRVRNGEVINWPAELDAMTLEQAAQDAAYAEEMGQRRALELKRIAGTEDVSEERTSDGSSGV